MSYQFIKFIEKVGYLTEGKPMLIVVQVLDEPTQAVHARITWTTPVAISGVEHFSESILEGGSNPRVAYVAVIVYLSSNAQRSYRSR